MMTGLYAESHGIVANDFYDPEQSKRFHCKPVTIASLTQDNMRIAQIPRHSNLGPLNGGEANLLGRQYTRQAIKRQFGQLQLAEQHLSLLMATFKIVSVCGQE